MMGILPPEFDVWEMFDPPSSDEEALRLVRQAKADRPGSDARGLAIYLADHHDVGISPERVAALLGEER